MASLGSAKAINVKISAATGLLLIALASGFACAQDYEREKRWADEITPGVVVGEALRIKTASGRDFLALHAEGKPGVPAIVLAHGVGVHPDHSIIGILRASLNDLGYTTTSIQLPVQDKNAQVDDYFPKVFPDAAERMATAAQWLRGRGHSNIILLSHSMGAWMANVYFDQSHETTPYRAWVVMGLTGGYSWGMRRYALPILDVYGEADLTPVLGAAGRRKFALKDGNGSRQVMLAGADHFYAGREKELAAAIDAFLKGLK